MKDQQITPYIPVYEDYSLRFTVYFNGKKSNILKFPINKISIDEMSFTFLVEEDKMSFFS
jgi:hypothetical protein